MKKIILGTLLSLIGNAQASIDFGDHFVCQNKIENYGPTLEIEVLAPSTPHRTNGLISFKVSAWGHSRNTYSAEYLSSIGAQQTRIGLGYYLDKFKDFSTWSDMPEKLSFYSIHFGKSFLFQGEIPGKGFVKVHFDENNCEEL